MQASVAPLVNFMCQEMAASFRASAAVVPPWRQVRPAYIVTTIIITTTTTIIIILVDIIIVIIFRARRMVGSFVSAPQACTRAGL